MVVCNTEEKNTLVFLNAESRRQTGTRSKAFVLQWVIYWTFSLQHCLNVAISVPGWKQGLPRFLLLLTIVAVNQVKFSVKIMYISAIVTGSGGWDI